MPPISTLESLLAPGETALAPGGTVIADGATGSELQRRGVLTPLPLWSTAALLTPAGQQTLQAIHADYLQAGAQFLTANTFRTHARNLRAAGLQDQAAELTRLAVQIAREAIEVTRCSGAFVAGSHAPLEDCYSPELTPPDAELRREHAHHVEHLAAAGVDFILIETMPTIREAVAAAEAAGAVNVPFGVSFVSQQPDVILSGESIAEAVRSVLPLGPKLLGINCAPAPQLAIAMRAVAAEVANFSAEEGVNNPPGIICYGNIGEPDPIQGWRNTTAAEPGAYTALAAEWHAAGARVIDGCCGTTPAHIAAIRRKLHGISP